MDNYDNSSGLAYGFMMLVLYFIVGVMLWLCWGVIFNMFLDNTVNQYITNGQVSIQTAQATAWSVNVLRFAPPIILLFGFFYGVNRAIFKRGGAS
jgi:hypothetical protein